MKQNITRETLLTAAKWAEADFLEEMHKVMPISRTAGRVGRSIAFGQAYLLDRFKLSFSQFGVTFGTESHQEEVESLSMILGKSREANAILVGDDKLSLYTILFNYGLRTERRVVLFDDSGFLAAFTDKSEFEKNLIRLVNEVSRAGDIVLVFPDFAEFMESASIRGSDVVMLLDPFFASSSMQIIATSTRDSYSRHFEHNPSLSTRFEKVMVQAETKESLEQFVVSRIKEVESREKVYFTAGALVTVRDAVMRFSPELMIDAADDLLHESVAKARSEKFKVIRSEHLLSLVESRTGVPVTAVSSAERTKLSKLEDLLRERIVGQEEAVSAISSALRRARAGVSSEKRPMGSFLFLGPTGVGKTETTKALSDIFFGTGAPMVRFDMSEYNDGSALERLLGSFEGNHPGTLASALREHEYGVLLLDEFEKTDKRVIDLFLQILDEGMFSDSRGKQVNVRNHIIVATSNAGSDTIFNFIKEGKNINTEKDAIIHDIINRGIFKPELLNRFDGTILFHPLTEDNLRAIARLMLNSLNKRLKAKGFELIINDEIVEFLVKKGQDPKFGARPLNRAIQDHIEANIAKKMLEGAIKAGDAITFRAGELNA